MILSGRRPENFPRGTEFGGDSDVDFQFFARTARRAWTSAATRCRGVWARSTTDRFVYGARHSKTLTYRGRASKVLGDQWSPACSPAAALRIAHRRRVDGLHLQPERRHGPREPAGGSLKQFRPSARLF